ncbi:hypothetical protein [Pantoea cypripedii]|uniref:Uncharacterized protein n=1 Tax=Pantoea cypripedii TaxID=55209 RepID=A0A6B9G4B4_PANCY|nr:hypothetical protein [Pantoea cypripedii]QGY29810.1 hypothetical protein CUN67_13090 [Pantoea cypripedii]
MPTYFYSGKVYRNGNAARLIDGIVDSDNAREARLSAITTNLERAIELELLAGSTFDVHLEQFHKVE